MTLLPYSEVLFGRIPVEFLKLKKVLDSAMENRDFRRDGYWEVTSDDEVLARLILKGGRPYHIDGNPSLDSAAFINWMEHETREISLTVRFLAEGCLPSLMKYLREDPVLTDLENGQGEVLQLLHSLRTSGESGLVSLRYPAGTLLIPIREGKVSRGWGSGTTFMGRKLVDFLKGDDTIEGVAEFREGDIRELSPLGIAEVSVILGSVNSWLDSLRPVWPQCESAIPELLSKLKKRDEWMTPLEYESGDNLFLREQLSDSSLFPDAMAMFVKNLCKKHPSPTTAMKLFTSINRGREAVLSSVGMLEKLV
jgi:hypothetical protein